MDFFAKKYTVLMNSEPVEIWIKNDQIKKAKFMEKEIDLKGLTKETISQIKDNPTKIINGNNLVKNENFVSNFSKVIDAQLALAIKKRDMETLSRFARSDLVPESHKKDFIEAINRPRGLRGIITNTINRINQKVQNIAAKIDNYFVNQRERIATQKMDKYLSAYSLKEFNKAPPLNLLDLNKNLNPELAALAQNFVKGKNIQEMTETKTEDKILQEEFFKQAIRNGHNLDDAKIALFKEVSNQQKQLNDLETAAKVTTQDKTILEMQATIKNLETELNNQKLKVHSKNESLEDFKFLTQNMDSVQKIDVLTENKEYLNMNDEQKIKVENDLLFSNNLAKEESQSVAKSLSKQAEETKAIAQAKQEQLAKPIDKLELNENWKLAQVQNRNCEIPSQKFMNLSALKFDGVSKQSLDKWANQMNEMRAKGMDVPSVQKVNDFVNASLKNAAALEKDGVLVKSSENEYRFKNDSTKEHLYNKEMQKERDYDLKETLKDIASQKAFEKIIDASGNIDVDRLMDYSNKLQEVSIQMQMVEKANNVQVTQDDLKQLNKSFEQSQNQSQSQGRGRA